MLPDQPHPGSSLVESRILSATSPDVSQPADALSDSSAISQYAYPSHTASTATPHNGTDPNVCFPHTPSGSPSGPSKTHVSGQCQTFLRSYHSEPDIQSITLQPSSCHCSSCANGAQYQQQRQNFQCGVTPFSLCSSSPTVSPDRRHSIVGFAPSPRWKPCRAEPLHEAITTIPIQVLPPITTPDENTSPVLQSYPPTFHDPYNDTIANVRSRTSSLVTSPSTAPEDLEGETSLNVSEAREQDQRMLDGWRDDAKSVLMFSGLLSAIIVAFLASGYNKLCPNFGGPPPGPPTPGPQPPPPPPPATSIILVNIIWLTSLVLNITSALFATLTLQWAHRYIQPPRIPSSLRDSPRIRSMHWGIVMAMMFLHPSVLLFLFGLVILFFTINRIVAIVTSIIVGIFGGVYLVLMVSACLDRNSPYRSPLSFMWSRRKKPGHT